MKILSLSFSNLKTIDGKWTIDFQKPEFNTQPFFLMLPEAIESVEQILINTIKLALFGPEKDSVELLGKAAEVSFSFLSHGKSYHASWIPGSEDEDCLHFVEDENGKVLAQKTEDIAPLIKRLIGIDSKDFEDAFCIRLKDFDQFFSDASCPQDKLISDLFSDCRYGSLTPLVNEISNQKNALLAASQNVLDNIKTLDPEEEEKMQQALSSSQQEQNSIQIEISHTKEAKDWLSDIATLQEEYAKLAKQQTFINSEITRFEVKRVVLEKASKANLLQPEFAALQALREQEKEEQRKVQELKNNIPHLTERSKVAATSLAEAEKNYGNLKGQFAERQKLCEKVDGLDKEIGTLQATQEVKREELARENAQLKVLASDLNRIKTQLSQSKIQQQLLKKKIDDLHIDSTVVNELGDIEEKVNQIESETIRAEQSAEKQRELQKEIEKNRALLLDSHAELNTLKKEEHAALSDKLLKEKMLSKLLGIDTEESLRVDLKEQESRLIELQNLIEDNNRLSELFEQQAKEKAYQEKNRHTIRLTGMVLAAAEQTLKDKIEVVKAYEDTFSFIKKVNELQSERDSLVNGKPCPLCGAIHHPYSTSLPYTNGIQEKLERAKSEESEARQAVDNAKEENLKLKTENENSAARCDQIELQISELSGKILSTAPSLELTTLKEKKPAAWSQLLKQKETVLSNKLEDIKAKLEKIQNTELGYRESLKTVEEYSQKVEDKKKQQDLREKQIRDHQATIVDLMKAEKEASLLKENLTRQMERLFTRFGIKASNGPLLKQNLPVLAKKREQWLGITKELQELDVRIAAETDSQSEFNQRHTDQKDAVDRLNKEIEDSIELVKKLQKERFDSLGTQKTSEVLAQASTEQNNALKLFEDAQIIYDERQSALTAAQDKIKEQEDFIAQLVETILTNSLKFSESLKENGFNNETIFQASHMSEAQRVELQRQQDDLDRKHQEITKEVSEKESELKALQALNLTTSTRTQLEDELNQKNADLARISVTVSTLRDALARNQNDKTRKQREGVELERLKKESELWHGLALECLEKEGMPLDGIHVALELFLEISSKKLQELNSDSSLAVGEDNKLVFVKRSQGNVTTLKLTELSEEDFAQVRLAMALAFAEIRSGHANPKFVLFNSDPSVNQEQTLAMLTCVHNQGKLVGVKAEMAGKYDKLPWLSINRGKLFEGTGVMRNI